jgi:Protein of unknown function (DUF2628)
MEDKNDFKEFENQFGTGNFDQIWIDRFQFFQKFGAPNTANYKAGLKEREGFIAKARINMNFYAFLFGFIYFFVKGMWKAGFTVLGISIAVITFSFLLPDNIADVLSRFTGIAISILAGRSANYTYYRQKVLNEDDFNIFKGL